MVYPGRDNQGKNCQLNQPPWTRIAGPGTSGQPRKAPDIPARSRAGYPSRRDALLRNTTKLKQHRLKNECGDREAARCRQTFRAWTRRPGSPSLRALLLGRWMFTAARGKRGIYWFRRVGLIVGPFHRQVDGGWRCGPSLVTFYQPGKNAWRARAKGTSWKP